MTAWSDAPSTPPAGTAEPEMEVTSISEPPAVSPRCGAMSKGKHCVLGLDHGGFVHSSVRNAGDGSETWPMHLPWPHPAPESKQAIDLTPEGEALRAAAAAGTPVSKPWRFIPCALTHEPNMLCIRPMDHGPVSTFPEAQVVAALWAIPGAVPEFHRAMKDELWERWPVLASALDRLVRQRVRQ